MLSMKLQRTHHDVSCENTLKLNNWEFKSAIVSLPRFFLIMFAKNFRKNLSKNSKLIVDAFSRPPSCLLSCRVMFGTLAVERVQKLDPLFLQSLEKETYRTVSRE